MTADPNDPGVPGVSVLGTAQRAAWLDRTLPPVERLPGGLWSVPVPIPDNPLRYTLCYLVPGDDGIVVVDPGWNTREGWDTLLAGLAEAGATTADVTGVVATHVHPDHHGLSGRLREESGVWVAMHPAERDTLPQRIAVAASRNSLPTAGGWLRLSGAGEDEIAELVSPFDESATTDDRAAMAEPDVLLEDGDLVPMAGRRLRAVWTPGHTPGHLCLQEPDARLLLTGDHVLPRITPNIGLYPNSAGSPLGRFLESLRKIEGYDDHDALPAHEYRFRGLAARTRLLREHHEERCREVVAVVAELGEPTVWEVARHLTWSRPWEQIGHMRFGALAETGAHIDHLVRRGELAWRHGENGKPIRVRSTT
ncbi:MBL fold metallo-hydrolase [Prauserella flavalba]|uniref:MBL fold metallo-hydrolase n=1 Tax=Prauserella flavalba TaxID=1477506 RepID=UPI0036E5351D